MPSKTTPDILNLCYTHWLENPNASIESFRLAYGLVRADVENSSAGPMAANTVRKFNAMFQEWLAPITLADEPIEAIESLTVMDKLAEQSITLVGIVTGLEALMNRARRYADSINTAISLVEDASLVQALVSQISKAEKDLNLAKVQIEILHTQAEAGKQASLIAGITYGEATG